MGKVKEPLPVKLVASMFTGQRGLLEELSLIHI